MFIRDLQECEEFVAGDNSILRELLHPARQDLQGRHGDLPLHYSLAHATVRAGETTLPHKLKSSEVYYTLEGRGLMFIDDESAEVGPGQAVYIPPHSEQRIQNLGTTDLKFLCIVDPAWRLEDEEVL